MSDSVTLGDPDLLAALQNIEEQRNTLYGEQLSLIAEASSRGLWCTLGYRDLPSVLVDTLRVGVCDAKHRVSHAEALLDSYSPTGAAIEATLPALGSAAAAGAVGPEAVHPLCHTLSRFPGHATDEDRVVAETILLDAARMHPPKTVARLGREILTRLDQDGNPPSDRELAEPDRWLNVQARRNGRVALRGELDVGRTTRVIPVHIRRALILRDRGCAFPTCDRPPKQCHGHHIRNWADGGATTLDNLVLLCGYHHHRIHHTQWSVRINHRRPEFIPPEYLDTHQQPRSNILHTWPGHYPAAA